MRLWPRLTLAMLLGLTACRSYSARGVAVNHSFDDGTLSPTALGGSLPFAAEIVLPAHGALRTSITRTLNTTISPGRSTNFQFAVKSTTGKIVPGLGWFANDYIGIDQGPILLMAENYRSELIWNVMKTNPYIRAGLQRAGFRGGWLNE